MGAKQKLEQDLRKAIKESRDEDAQAIREAIANLKKARGDAAWERAKAKQTYQVKEGDSPFSIAADLYGDERFAQQLLRANPDVYSLWPGMYLYAPSLDGPAPSLSHQEFEALLDWGKPFAEEFELPEAQGEGEQEVEGAEKTGDVEAVPEATTLEGFGTPEEEAQLDEMADGVVALMKKLGLLEEQGTIGGVKVDPLPALQEGGEQKALAREKGLLVKGGDEELPFLTTQIEAAYRRWREAEQTGDTQASLSAKRDFETKLAVRQGELPPPEVTIVNGSGTPMLDEGSTTIHKVKPNESVIFISNLYGISINNLLRFNENLGPNPYEAILYENDVIVIPLALANDYQASESLKEKIKELEGFVPYLYNDSRENCTIGYGHLVHLGACDGREDELEYQGGVSDETGLDLLAQDFNIAEEVVKNYTDSSISQEQFDALVSLAFNLGGGNFLNSPFLELINQNEMKLAVEAIRNFGGSNREPGLDARRNWEAELFASGIKE